MKDNLTSVLLSGQNQMLFSRLTFEDIPQISNFLMSVWPKLYGDLGHPSFTEDYLRWLFGGPHQDKHFLVGAQINNSLVAYHSFLYRTISYCGKLLKAYIHTHATISPQLESSIRINCAMQMAKQHVVFNEYSQFCDTYCDMVYSFQDIRNPVRAFGEKVLKKYFKIKLNTFSVFNQFVVMPNRLKKYVAEIPVGLRSFEVRLASAKECYALTELFNRHHEESQLIMQMTEEELKYHFFSHPEHHTYVVEEHGALKALINFYPARIIKANKSITYVLIEFLISSAQNKEYAACLLQEAVSFGESIGAKGVVFENANYLDYSSCNAIGLAPTLRKMTMSAIAREEALTYSGTFRCDVK